MVTRPRRRFHAPPAVGPVLIALLAGGYGPPARAQAPAGAGQPPPAAQAPPAAPPDYGYFERLKKQMAEQRKKADEHYQKAREAAKPHIEEQVKAHGGGDQARRQLGLTPEEINARLKPGAPPLPPGAPGSRIEPGMRVDVIMKDGVNRYSGALVGIDGTKVLLQTIPLPGAQPSAFDISDIAAFQTKNGIYAYNPRTGRVVPALTYYRLNNATGEFERLSAGAGDAFLGENAKIVGPANSAWASLSVGQDGSLVLGLPIPTPESPQSIPAYQFNQIVTPEGTYTYNAQTKNFTYETHAQVAAAAQNARDAAGKAYYKQQWDRDVQTYQLQTDRIAAMQPYFSSYWGGGPIWPWWLPRTPRPPVSPGEAGAPPPP